MIYLHVSHQSELPGPILRNSVESDHGCASRIYFDNAGDNVTLTSQKPCLHNNKFDCSKTNGLTEVYGFGLMVMVFRMIRIIDFNRAEASCDRTNFPYASSS